MNEEKMLPNDGDEMDMETQGFEVVETDEPDAPEVEIEMADDDDFGDGRTLNEVYTDGVIAINDARDELIKMLAGSPSDTTMIAWRTEKNAALAVKNGTASPEMVQQTTAVALAGGDTLEEYIVKVLAKAEYLETKLVMSAAILVRTASKKLEAAYSEAKTMEETVGIEHVEAVLSATLEDAYSQAESYKAAVAQ